MTAVPEGWKLVPVNDTEEQWGELARDIMLAFDMNAKTPSALRNCLENLGRELPHWLCERLDGLGQNGVMSKGVRVGLAYRAMIEDAPSPAPAAQGEALPIELTGVAESLAQGSGFWAACSGCHELNEGYSSGAYSSVFKCALGNGCSECGGLGAVWDTTDYDAMAEALAAPERAEAEHATLYRWLRDQHWHSAALCVVLNPKEAVKLGHDCPSGERLDGLIKAEIERAKKNGSV